MRDTMLRLALAFFVGFSCTAAFSGCGSAAMLGRATAGIERGAVLLDVVVEQTASEYASQVEKRTAECEAAKPDSQSAFERCMAPFDAEARRKVALALEKLTQSQEVLAEVVGAAHDLSDALPEAPSP
jgi:hypothetical protein